MNTRWHILEDIPVGYVNLVNKNENVQYTLGCNKNKLCNNKEPVMKSVSGKTARSCAAYFRRRGSLKPRDMVNIIRTQKEQLNVPLAQYVKNCWDTKPTSNISTVQ
jgi:hypothetical protein